MVESGLWMEDAVRLLFGKFATDDASAYGGHIDAPVGIHVATNYLGIARPAKLMQVVVDARPRDTFIIAAIQANGLRSLRAAPNIERGIIVGGLPTPCPYTGARTQCDVVDGGRTRVAAREVSDTAAASRKPHLSLLTIDHTHTSYDA